MKIIKVDEDICVECRNCVCIQHEMPEVARGDGWVIPKWSISCFNAAEDMLLGVCNLDALSVVNSK